MENQVKQDGYLFSKGYTRYVFTLLFLLYMFDYIDRMVISALIPFIKNDPQWAGVSDTHIALLNSVIYWSIGLLTIPASFFVDRWSRRKTIGLMAIFWSLATASATFIKTFPQLMVSRTFIGIGEAGYAPGGSAMISGMYPKEKRSWMMGLWNASIPLGSAIGAVVGGIIASHWGWKSAFGIIAIPGLIIAILFYFIKDYKTVGLVKSIDARKTSTDTAIDINSTIKVKMSFRDIVREFSTKPSLLYTYFGMTGIVFVTTSLLFWLPDYFSQIDRALTLDQAGKKAGVIMLLALVGAPLGGFIVDRWRKKRINARVLFPAITTLVATIVMFISFSIFDGTNQYISLLFFGMIITMFIPAAGAVTQDLVHPGLRATSYSIAVIIQNLLGASLGPLVIGIISDRTNLGTALTILPAFLLISSILFFIGSHYFKKDLEKVEDIKLEVAA